MGLELENVKQIFDQLYKDVDGRSLSLKGREEAQLSSKSFVYGEVVPDGFYQMMKEANPYPGQVFYDLGSGTGKGVLLAHLLFDFSKSIGIELLEPLYNASIEVQKRYNSEILPTIADEVKGRTMELHLGSFLDYDLSNADFIFMNSTCFQEDLMEALEEKLEMVPANAMIISLSKGLKSPAFHQYRHKLFDFSWGQATAFFHRKRLWKMYF